MRILIFGLPGSGKTTLAQSLLQRLSNAVHLNADAVREQFNDWDFSPEGRMRQAYRMRILADQHLLNADVKFVVSDFVAPTKQLRSIYDPAHAIWMNTIPSGRFEDTNKMFEPPAPQEYQSIVTNFNAPVESARILSEILYHAKI